MELIESKMPGELDDYPALYTAIGKALDPVWEVEWLEEKNSAHLHRQGYRLYLYHDRYSHRIHIKGEFYVKLPDQDRPACFYHNPQGFEISCTDKKTPEQIARDIQSRLLPKYAATFDEKLRKLLDEKLKERLQHEQLSALAELMGKTLGQKQTKFQTNCNNVNIDVAGWGEDFKICTFKDSLFSIGFSGIPADVAKDILTFAINRIQQEEPNND